MIPLASTGGPEIATPSLHREVRAFVSGYNTVPGQTDSTPCIAASGADICGRRDAVACPRQISLGTTVEIRGTTYVCEDRLAKKFDKRFDISCDKDTDCPAGVTGWAIIKVYDDNNPQLQKAPAVSIVKGPAVSIVKGMHHAALSVRSRGQAWHPLARLAAIVRPTARRVNAVAASVLRGRG